MTTGRGRGSSGPDEAATLSEDEVERRLEGGAGVRVMHVRPRVTPSRQRIARDTGIILAGALIAIAAGQLLGGGNSGVGPSDSGEVTPTEIVTRSEAPVDSRVAVASLPPPATIGPIVNPSLDVGASPTPIPIATLPPTTVTVVLKVRNDAGGNDVPGDWRISITGAHASPSSFAGSANGTKVVVDGLQAFQITTSPKTDGGYAQSRSGNCSGPVPKGLGVTCTITEHDKPVKLTVKVVVNDPGGLGGLTPSQVKVTVTQAGATQKLTGSKAGTTVSLDSNRSWTTTATTYSDYQQSKSSYCKEAGVREGRELTCTIAYTYNPPLVPALGFGPLIPIVPLWRRRTTPIA